MSLPIIPLSAILPSSPNPLRLATVPRLHAACVEYGFFYLDLTGFATPEETEELRALAQEFFDLPKEEKEKIWLGNGDWARGYQKLNENVTRGKPDAHEALDFYAPSPFPPSPPGTPGVEGGVRPLSGDNQWPPDPRYKERFERWVGKMKQLGLIVMEAMALGLQLNWSEWADLRRQVENSFWVMRVIGYPPLPAGHDGFSCGAHKDYGCLTFLWADKTEGALQVFVPEAASASSAPVAVGTASTDVQAGNMDLGPSVENGVRGTWISADPVEGCVVCNIGEMWEVWTRGLYKSTLHRVLHRTDNYRRVLLLYPCCWAGADSSAGYRTIPFFYEPAFDALVAPLPGVDRLLTSIRGNPDTSSEAYARALLAEKTVYEPVVYGEFLMRKVGGNFDKTGGEGRY
ncbi:Clavaminate synthase-like protein [Calocera cornea HHB12733]|uniref:Clavaminate synthase-like protein n=1 Tax=Calocera cornea HHB12733 TaxID=1353952 RepID=A0A165F868_9BASI|nr:Clavaminate synthase-like protein [Calocera cornea HHB12733]